MNFAEYFCFALVVLCAHLLGGLFQENISVHGGLGWDGRVYFQMGLQSLAGEEFSQRSPFVHRQLLPWLAARFADGPRELLSSFRVVNLVAATAASFLILAFMRDFIRDWRIRVLVASLYPLHYLGHIRSTYWYAPTTGPLMVLAAAAGLVMMQKIRAHPTAKNIALLSAVCFLAALNRTSSLIVPVAALFCLSVPQASSYFEKTSLYIRRWKPMLLLPTAGLVAAYLLTRANAEVTGHYGGETLGGELTYFKRIVTEMYNRSLLQIFLGVFLAWGPMLAVLLWRWAAVWRMLREHWHLLAFMGIVVVYGIFDDIARFAVWAMPIYCALLGVALENGRAVLSAQKWLLPMLLLAQAVSQRLFWAIPSQIPDEPSLVPPDTPLVLPTLFTPWTENFLYYDMSILGSRGFFGPLALFQYAAFIAIALLLLNFFTFRQSVRAAEKGSGQ